VGVVTHMKSGIVLGGRSGPQFCGFPSTRAYMVRSRTTKFGVVTDGEGWSLGAVSHAITFAQMRRAVCQRMTATAEFVVW